MKNNIGFFTHEVEAPEHRKFLILRSSYEGDKGWAMEARFWALNCLIGKADDCKLDLNSKGEKARVARFLELSLSELDTFLHILKDEAELIHDDGGVIWTDQTQDDLSRARSARNKAKDRRNRRNKPASGDECKTSGDESQTSADEMHGGEGKGREGIGVEGRRSEEAAAPLVDNSPKSQEAELYAFALARVLARAKKPDHPEVMAKKIMHEPDVLEAFESSKLKAPSGMTRFAEKPTKCPSCGKKITKFDLLLGEARCMECGAFLAYDYDFGYWKAVPVEDSA